MDNNFKREEYLEQIDTLKTLIQKVDPDNKIYQSTLNQLEEATEKINSNLQEPQEQEQKQEQIKKSRI